MQLLLAEQVPQHRKDALARRRTGRNGEDDACRQRPRLERRAVVAPLPKDPLGEVGDRGPVKMRRATCSGEIRGQLLLIAAA